MADDEKEDEEEEESKPKKAAKSGSPMKLILVIFGLLLVLGGIGAFVVVKFVLPALGAKPAVEGEAVPEVVEKKDKEKKKKDNWVGPMHPMDPFVVNLAASGGRRFLKVTLELELSSENMEEELSVRKAQIRDTIITVLSSKTFDDIYSVHGKFKSREELIRRINTFLEKGQIMNIYFTEFVIQ